MCGHMVLIFLYNLWYVSLIQCALFFVTTETTLMLDRPIRVDQSTDLIDMFEQTIE
jgi:hypothetical protein